MQLYPISAEHICVPKAPLERSLLFRMEHFAEDSEFLLARRELSRKLAHSWRHKHKGPGGTNSSHIFFLFRNAIIWYPPPPPLLNKISKILGKVYKVLKMKVSQACDIFDLRSMMILRKSFSGEGWSKFELERSYYSKLTISEVEGLVQIYR